MAEQKISPVQIAQARPLSPHLMIYRPMMTMMMSIAHRITGAAGPDTFGPVAYVMGSIVGRLVLFLFTWALFHHFCGGIRHFVWDLGYGMGDPDRELFAWGTLIGGFVLTLLVWAAALFF